MQTSLANAPTMSNSCTRSRRRFLQYFAGAALSAAGAAITNPALAAPPQACLLSFDNTHTLEQISLTYSVGGRYVSAALDRLNHFLRDHYTDDVGNMDPQLFDILHAMTLTLGCTGRAYEVISGYRCPATNRRLRATRGGGVARRSLHMEGKAIDIRLPGVPLAELRDVALSLEAGGVGFYPGDEFIHVDTGRVRTWEG